MATKPVAKPQDHKQKQDKPKVEESTRTIGGRELPGWEVTHFGVTVFVIREAMDDFELLEDIAALDKRKGQALPGVLRRMLAVGDFDKAMAGLRDKTTGRVSLEKGSQYVFDILGSINPNS